MAKIRINESRLNEIIKESINNVLTEINGNKVFGPIDAARRGFETFRNTEGGLAHRFSKGAQTTNFHNTYINIMNEYEELEENLKKGIKNGFITQQEFEGLRGHLSFIKNLIDDKASEAGVGFGNN